MRAERGRLIAAYATVYLVWGSSYLFMKFASESIPVLLLSGARYTLAGLVLTLAMWAASVVRPTGAQWRAAAIVGAALVGSNAAVTYSVTRIPTGVSALLTALTPCWIVLLEWLEDRAQRPQPAVVVGLGVGLAGVLVLIGPAQIFGAGAVDPLGAAAVLAGAFVWAAGSLYSRRAPRPSSALLMSGMQMLMGGIAVLTVGVVAGAVGEFSPSHVSVRSWGALAYLVFVAAIGGYTAYVYLLSRTSPARASTYAYVNPLIAVVLGAAFARESLSPRLLIAAVGIVTAVAIILLAPRGTRRVVDTSLQARAHRGEIVR